MRTEEAHSLLCDLCQLQKRHHLEATRCVSNPLLYVHGLSGSRTHHCLHQSALTFPLSSSNRDRTCQQIMRPCLELVRAADGIESCLSGFKASPECQHCRMRLRWTFSQMVCVVQAQSASCLFELLRSKTLQRCLRSHGHEDGQRNGSVGKVECRGARFCDGAFSEELEAQSRRH